MQVQTAIPTHHRREVAAAHGMASHTSGDGVVYTTLWRETASTGVAAGKTPQKTKMAVPRGQRNMRTVLL